MNEFESIDTFDFDDVPGGNIEIIDPEKTKGRKKLSKRRTTACITRDLQTVYRRAFSESQLLDVLPRDFNDGECYHCITAGDVDALSYLKVVIRQQNLNYCLFSTWCMATDDILQFEEWLTSGKIKHLDAYVGEIFPGTYKQEYIKLKEVIGLCAGRIGVFRNHSKIFAGFGDKFYFGIEMSANINTNPRAENGCITISKDIYHFYREYFDGIVSFDKDYR